MTEKKQKEPSARPTLGERISRALTLPTDFLSAEKLEWHNGGLCVAGCRRILLYSPGEIRLRLTRRVLVIRGAGLCCSSFSAGDGTIGVEGAILSLTFEGGLS